MSFIGDAFLSKVNKMSSLNFSVAGLVNGAMKVFNAASGNLMAVLDNQEVVQDAMPISRVRSGNSICFGPPTQFIESRYNRLTKIVK